MNDWAWFHPPNNMSSCGKGDLVETPYMEEVGSQAAYITPTYVEILLTKVYQLLFTLGRYTKLRVSKCLGLKKWRQITAILLTTYGTRLFLPNLDISASLTSATSTISPFIIKTNPS